MTRARWGGVRPAAVADVEDHLDPGVGGVRVLAAGPAGAADAVREVGRVDRDGRGDAESIVGHDPETVATDPPGVGPGSRPANWRLLTTATPLPTLRDLAGVGHHRRPQGTDRTHPQPNARGHRPVSNVPGGNNVGVNGSGSIGGTTCRTRPRADRAPMLFLALLAVVALVVAACGGSSGGSKSGSGSGSGGSAPTAACRRTIPARPRRAARSPTASRARPPRSARRVASGRSPGSWSRARSTTR